MRQAVNITHEQAPAQPLAGARLTAAIPVACAPRASALPPLRFHLAAGSLLGGPVLRACLGQARFLQTNYRDRREGVPSQGPAEGTESVLGGARGGLGLVKGGPPHYS
jgi:hypothetical protein